jgi:hypothetical protein
MKVLINKEIKCWMIVWGIKITDYF